MTTANDVVTGALKRLGIVAAGETPSSEDAADCLQLFNDMLFELELKGVNLGHSTLALADTVNLPESHMKGLKCMLAVEAGPEFEREASPSVQAKAIEAESVLSTMYGTVNKITVDKALLSMSAVRSR